MRKWMLVAAVLCVACDWTPWRTLDARDGTFTVRIPHGRLFERTGRASMTWTTIYNGTQCMVQEFYEPRYDAVNAQYFLRDYPNPRAAGFSGKVVDAYEVHSGPFTGRGVRMEGTVSGMHVVQLARAFVADGRLYVLTVAGPNPDSRIAKKFLDSFELKR